MVQSTGVRALALKRLLSDNLAKVRDRIAQAAIKVDRDPNRIQLLAVTKTVEMDAIRTLLELGQADIGESRVQQLVQRAGILQEQTIRRSMLDTDHSGSQARCN